MERDLNTEIDELKKEVRNISDAVKVLQGTKPTKPDSSEPERASRATALHREYSNLSGFISYFGFYGTPTPRDGYNDYHWDMGRSAEDLLAMEDDKVAKVLSALGNKQRLMLLKSILREPGSAIELVERLNMGTKGQVYHHLRALQTADLVEQKERGVYYFKGHRAQSLLMLLTGVADVLDSKYSSGNWDGEQQTGNM